MIKFCSCLYFSHVASILISRKMVSLSFAVLSSPHITFSEKRTCVYFFYCSNERFVTPSINFDPVYLSGRLIKVFQGKRRNKRKNNIFAQRVRNKDGDHNAIRKKIFSICSLQYERKKR